MNPVDGQQRCPQCGNGKDDPREDSTERMLACGHSFHGTQPSDERVVKQAYPNAWAHKCLALGNWHIYSDKIANPKQLSADCFNMHTAEVAWASARAKLEVKAEPPTSNVGLPEIAMSREEAINALGQCYMLSGADPDIDADEPWRLAPHAVAEVSRLRRESDEADDELLSLQSQLQEARAEIQHFERGNEPI